MKKTLQLTEKNRLRGSYLRKDYKTDVLNWFFRCQEINITIPKYGSSPRVNDDLVDRMLSEGLISQNEKEAYEHQVGLSLACLDQFDEYSMEEMYRHIHGVRRQVLGADALEKARVLRMHRPVEFDPTVGIDQRKKKNALLNCCESVIFLLLQPELFFLMKEDLDKATLQGKEVYILVSRERGDTLPTREALEPWLRDSLRDDLAQKDGQIDDPRDGHAQNDEQIDGQVELQADELRAGRAELQADGQRKGFGGCADIHFLEADMDHAGGVLEGIRFSPELQSRIDRGEACLFVYGEEGLLHCRSLRVAAVVSAIPEGYHARAVTNQLNCRRACVVYVPKGFDVTRWVRLTEKTRLSYWQLANLWEAYGDGIYDFSPEELYRRYPQYFINIYNNLSQCTEAKPEYPITVSMPENAVMEQFDRLREQAIDSYLNQFQTIRYEKTCFDGPILVNAVRVKKAEGARVVRCEKGTALREMFSGEGLTGPAIVSNFLFFLTPKLAALYNDLRKDRPREQVDIQVGHLDYMLYEKEGKRIETFPLFRKTCIAMKENGEFLFFNFRLGGGRMSVGGFPLSWEADDVDVHSAEQTSDAGADVHLVEQTADSGADVHLVDQSPVRIYTPYYSLPDGDADRQTYRKLVGEGRLNLVILQDKICCVREGDVILPGFGVVVSLEESLGQKMLGSLGLQPLEDGYYDAGGLELTVELDAPGQISREQWAQVKWAYGGGLSLILDGKGLCDGDMEQWFEEEGWMTPLSRQTQESALHRLEKHPRTAIGTTENGDLVILVYSGRTKLSVGADYREMSEIARRMFPDIRTLMNVDGGGSAVLGMVVNGSFMELSCPSTSTDSCVGMTRPVNTVLYIPAGE
ncbi:MAG: phosphodiester glycosidase family protein [Lachnospiraceae bacterium]|nr:phosphodiester glycosidase family protein [Lachnospiraceae bacterium]